ncbi:E3 ubiquitin-protein ligase [Colletotrichum spinosum]|uniref:E3 ubiquitin-protein ligase n=1 Tax=Colletotrichum spinosum TaxID=1347390 RepID=A0A4R8Q8C0_9PEZI|nr:E3 ubiquitin-protein ligase [Colletotrichum spinosum]
MGSGSSKAEKQELKANRKQKGLARTTPPPVQGLQSLDSPLVVPPAKSPAHPRPGSRKATNEKRPDQTLQEDASSSKSLKHKEHSFLASVFRGHVRRRRKAPPIDSIDEEIINPMDDTDEEIVGSMDNVDGNVLKLGNAIEEETKSACLAAALEVFPDIDPGYLEKKCVKLRHDQGQVIDAILADSESSKPYPKRTKSLKRKRGASGKIDETARARLKYDNENRVEASLDYTRLSRKLLAQDFPRATAKSISQLMSDNNNLLLRSYLALDQLDRERLAGRPTPGFEWKKSRTPAAFHYTPPNLDQTIRDVAAPDQKRALEELRDARKVLKAQEDERSSAKEKEIEEAENFIKAQEDGTTAECGCCFGDFAMNRMVCCANPDEMHYFCVECARRNAETAVGLTKHEFSCMSMDGCSAGFSHSQRALFLDDKIIAALDRIEAEAVLRMAGVENLENCPFCPFAAEYSPIEEDKEFRCANPECEIVSCRLCREETHVPKTCEEAAKDHGFSARRQIEEAMSAALIRKCNKCGTPFIKDQGCNKMTCSRCNNIQCYVCSASCDYSHFDDSSRGGKKGNCPLFEQSEDRHDREVREAEERTRQKVLNDNPDLNEEQLRVHAADASKKRKDKKADARRWRAGQARLRDRYRRLPAQQRPNEPRQSMERNQMQVNSQAANNDQPGYRVSRWGLAPAVLGLNPQLGWGTAYQNNDMVQQNNRNMASAGRTRENPLELD